MSAQRGAATECQKIPPSHGTRLRLFETTAILSRHDSRERIISDSILRRNDKSDQEAKMRRRTFISTSAVAGLSLGGARAANGSRG